VPLGSVVAHWAMAKFMAIEIAFGLDVVGRF
jgi:hypothetical protein